MESDSTPGQMATVRCPHCQEAVFFVLGGGPRTVPCPHCRKTIALEVVHDGRKWTVRRVRQSDKLIGPA